MSAVVLVTGASSGIGEATALRAAARGDHVALLARREDERRRVADACERAGAASTLVLPADIADDAAAAGAVRRVVAELGRIDVTVGDAGVIAFGDLGSVPVEVFDQVIVTNVLGQANLARRVLPQLREPGGGTRRRSQVGAFDDVMRLGFSLTPRVYDVLVGPLSRRVIRHGRVADAPGNVIEPTPDVGASDRGARR